MRGLTIQQPWASLIALGVKQVETRGWRTEYRGPLAVHAGMQNHTRVGRDLPSGVIVATCVLRDVIPAWEATVGDVERCVGDYSLGRWAWLLDDVTPLRTPVRCRGAQGLWTVPPQVARQVDAAALHATASAVAT